MQTYSSVFERELLKLIDAKAQAILAELAAGYSITTIEAYREKVGKLAGLREVIDLFEEANDLVSKRERGI